MKSNHDLEQKWRNKIKKILLRDYLYKPFIAWVCIDKNEPVNYIHHGKQKPLSDTNYEVCRAKISPIKPKSSGRSGRGK